ncbi:hypothetical protein ACRRTK_000836 [Alexandromys fortis]
MLASGLLLVTVLGFLIILVFMSVWKQRKFSGKLPPGPTPLPFIGNYLQLDTEQMYNSLMKISERYGPVFTIHLGPRRIVVLCGQEAVKEALVDQAEEFSGRGEQATFDWLFKGYGLVFSTGDRAKQLRRFSIATLRDFGLGKRGIEERIQEEAVFLLEAFRKTNGAPLDLTLFFQCIRASIICSIVFEEHLDNKDQQFLPLLKLFYWTFSLIISFSFQVFELFSGFLKYFPGTQRQVCKKLQGILEYTGHNVEQNQSTLDPNSPRDFIDSFLIRMQQEKKNPNTEFYMKNLVMATVNLFFAGTETVSTTLRYGFLLLMKHPDVQAKVQEEIDRVIGKNRQPKYEDRLKMPYTEAVIHEIQRFGDMIPMGLARRVTKDTKFRDFFIPKGTEVFPMLGSVLKDPKIFSNPKDFNPNHFLDDKGQFKKSDAFVPFSIGKRYCFGEGLARMELFLFFTNILQNFCFRSPQAPQDIDVSPRFVGFATIPPNYTMSFLSR